MDFLNRIIDFSLHNRMVVILGVLAAGVAGAFSLQHLDIDAFPDTTPVQVQINTPAPGYSPLETEQRITYALETAMAGLPKLEQTRSLSRYGLSQVTVIFKEGTDIYFARQLVSERLQAAKEQLPDGISPSMGPVSTGLGEIYLWTVEADANARKPDGTAYRAGDLFKQPDLAWTLTRIRDGGADAFYKGAVARKLVAGIKAGGGIIDMQDLASFKAKVSPPIWSSYRGLKIAFMPPTASGVTLAEVMNILEHFPMKEYKWGSVNSLHVIAEAMKIATADRRLVGGGPQWKTPVGGLAGKAYAAERAKLISMDTSLDATTMPDGMCVRRMADEVLFTFWPPAPLDRYTSSRTSAGLMLISMLSLISGKTQTLANDV